MRKPLPIGIQTFRKLIEGGYLYIDKTPLIYKLIHTPSGVYFLSRPRRFGKSLLISTLEEIFLGNKELFQGLWLFDSDYSWQAHPLIRIDFSLERVRSAAQMEEVIGHYLEEVAWSYELELIEGSYQRQFRWLIQQLAQKDRVVILIDEYDYPIIDNIENPAVATEVRDVLKGFYTVIKAMDRYIRFVFLTGISKFSRVGVFSGLNNLQDISMDSRYAALPGITQAELESEFTQRLEHFAEHEATDKDSLLAKIKEFFFAQIPYGLQINQERYYQSIFYIVFTLIGLRLDAERQTNRGRIDAVIELSHAIYLFEFKLDGSVDAALQQILDTGYADAYRGQGKAIHLVGANFSSTDRTVTTWKIQTIAAIPSAE